MYMEFNLRMLLCKMIINPSKPAHSDFQYFGRGKNFAMKAVL